MTRLVRAYVSSSVDLLRYVWGTGRWWVGFIIPALVVATALFASAKLAVPTVVYAFF